MKILTFFFTLALLAAASPAAGEPDTEALRERIEQAVLEWIDSQGGEVDRGQALSLRIDSPEQYVADAGIVFDGTWKPLVDSDGLHIVAVRPGGAASRMGLRAGDRIVVLNGIDLRHLGSTEDGRARAADALAGLMAATEPGQDVALTVKRGDLELSAGGKLDGRYLPPIQLALGQSALAANQGDTGSVAASSRGCGVISSLAVTPRTRDLYPVMVVGIDGSEWFRSSGRSRWAVPEGTYRVRVIEMISDPRLRVSGRHRGYSKTIEVTVERNRVYELGARFNADKRFRGVEGDYWEPEVWREFERECRRVDFHPEPL